MCRLLISMRSSHATGRISSKRGRVESPGRLRVNRQSVFNMDAFAENAIRSNPAVDQSLIVADLISSSVDGLHDVQIVVAANPAEHDVADLECRRIDRSNGA